LRVLKGHCGHDSRPAWAPRASGLTAKGGKEPPSPRTVSIHQVLFLPKKSKKIIRRFSGENIPKTGIIFGSGEKKA